MANNNNYNYNNNYKIMKKLVLEKFNEMSLR